MADNSSGLEMDLFPEATPQLSLDGTSPTLLPVPGAPTVVPSGRQQMAAVTPQERPHPQPQPTPAAPLQMTMPRVSNVTTTPGNISPEENFVVRIRDLGERSGPMGSPNSISPKGAMGRMQVMPGTARDPGMGIRPAADFSENELYRVGSDYAKALYNKYGGNMMLASAAYNAGPGNVDKWIAKFGDPRTGAISPADWVKAIPPAETRAYIARVTGGDLGAVGQRQTTEALPFPAQDTSKANLLGGLSQGMTDPNKMMALAMLQKMLPSTHTLQKIDYDPFVTPKQESMYRASQIDAPQLHELPSGKAPGMVSMSPGASVSPQAGMQSIVGSETGHASMRGRPHSANSASQYGH